MGDKFNPAPIDKHAASPKEAAKADKATDNELQKGASDSDLELLGKLIKRAGFSAIYLSAKSIFVESFIIYELRQR